MILVSVLVGIASLGQPAWGAVMPIPLAKKAARNSRYRRLTYGLGPGLDFALCRALDLLLGIALAVGAMLSLVLLTAALAKPANAAEGSAQFFWVGAIPGQIGPSRGGNKLAASACAQRAGKLRRIKPLSLASNLRKIGNDAPGVQAE